MTNKAIGDFFPAVGKNSRRSKGQSSVSPPLMATNVAAGFPSPAEQYAEEPLDLNDLMVHNPPATFFVRVAGDSMDGAGIFDGDILVVDRSQNALNGSIVIACVDGDFTVKRLRKSDGKISLEAENPKYKPIVFTGEVECRIFGVITGLLRQFKRNGHQ